MAQVTFMFIVTKQPLAPEEVGRLCWLLSHLGQLAITYSEFWLGLESIRRLTNSGGYKLRIDLEDFSGNTVYAEYTWFKVESEGSHYTLRIGSYSGKLAPGNREDFGCVTMNPHWVNKQSVSSPFNKTLFWRRLEAIWFFQLCSTPIAVIYDHCCLSSPCLISKIVTSK